MVPLNPAQHDAVRHEGGPLLVSAGAGSGKTRVLTHRIAHLISDRGVSPFAILAITFTNKAAEEMRARVVDLVGPVAQRMWVRTFHSACARILRVEAKRLGYPAGFSIYDQADSVRLTRYVMADLGLDTRRSSPQATHGRISAAKNDMVSPEAYAASAAESQFRLAEPARVYAEYQRRLQRAG
ncbi:MAG: AAA family ATPase, partial [Acidimicrobiia bacterium]|nr:AAA family ATPase [Acidimicrobiia bacterium]